jgi:hypothetical protein
MFLLLGLMPLFESTPMLFLVWVEWWCFPRKNVGDIESDSLLSLLCWRFAASASTAANRHMGTTTSEHPGTGDAPSTPPAALGHLPDVGLGRRGMGWLVFRILPVIIAPLDHQMLL